MTRNLSVDEFLHHYHDKSWASKAEADQELHSISVTEPIEVVGPLCDRYCLMLSTSADDCRQIGAIPTKATPDFRDDILQQIVEAFQPVAQWYIPEGDETYVDEYPAAIASAVEDLVMDRNNLNDLRRAVSKLIDQYDRDVSTRLRDEYPDIEKLRELIRPIDR